MKFRDPKTGNVFDCIIDAVLNFCGTKSTQQCLAHGCPIERKGLGNGGCVKWAEEHPTEAARLMGHEVIDDSSSDSSSDSSTEIDDTPTTLDDTQAGRGDRPTEEDEMKCYRNGGCGPYEQLSCGECPASKPEYKIGEDEGNTKQDKSRLAEVLGVEEDELWKYGEKMFRFHGGFREVWEDDAWQIRTDEIELTKIINHPEDIVKVRLTEPELAICKSVGAKWVSRDDSPDDGWVSLWAEKPEKYKMVYLVEPGGNLARVLGEKFPSVEPGDCIGLRDMEDDVV